MDSHCLGDCLIMNRRFCCLLICLGWKTIIGTRQRIPRPTFLQLARVTSIPYGKRLLPFIGTMKPATDLCFDCQQNITRISRSAHLPIEEKSQRFQAAEAHLTLARTERQNYNQQIEAAKESYIPGQRPSVMHYSFDYAQQVHFPNNPQQTCPAYFLSARNCQIFGIACEPTGKQVNYLIDEGETIGKGANATVSLLNHFLDNHGLKEDNMFLHADNCVAQNKNNVLIQYLLFRTLKGHHKSITLSFVLPGHTKFALDGYYGLLKKTYRRTYVGTCGDDGVPRANCGDVVFYWCQHSATC